MTCAQRSSLLLRPLQGNTLLTAQHIGIDEAGRGCLAGPVVAAAVVLPQDCSIQGIDDSKKLTAQQRQGLAKEIFLYARAIGIGVVWQQDVDRLNILQATFHAMSKALYSLTARSNIYTQYPLYIDGNKTIPLAILQSYCAHSYAQQAIVGGDGRFLSIGAASIVAKTHRDTLMTLLHRRWPQYNFAKHKGYGTQAHREAIARYGPCPLHRMTFAPLCSKLSKYCVGSLLCT